jgi:undecaprenyl-diphosphatase
MDAKKSQGAGGGKLKHAIILTIVILGAWVLALMFLDVSVSQWIAKQKIPRLIDDGVNLFNSYNTPIGLGLLGVTAAISAGANRWRLIGHLVLGLLISGGLVWVGKLLVKRQRPKVFEGSTWVETFQGYLPNMKEFKFQSLPSGDAAVAFAVTFILVKYFPQHRYVLYVLAVGCALSRVILRYHYVSDVILGAAIGYLSAKIVLYLSSPSGNK